MKKSISRSKSAGPSVAGEKQKDARPERFNRARPARNNNPEAYNPEPNNPESYNPESHRPAGNSTIHNGSAGAFNATEEVRD